MRVQLELRPVGFAPKHGSGVGRRDHSPLAIGHAGAAVGDAEVDPAIGTFDQPVQVVPAEGDVDAEAGQEFLAKARRGGPVRLRFGPGGREPPEVRDARKPDVRPLREHARRHAARDAVEAGAREGRRVVRLAVRVGVGHEADPFGFHFQVVPVDDAVAVEVLETAAPALVHGLEEGGVCGVLRVEQFTEQGGAFGFGAEREVVAEPGTEVAHVEDARAAAAGLDDVGASVVVEAEAGDVLDERFAGPEGELKAGRDREAAHGGKRVGCWGR